MNFQTEVVNVRLPRFRVEETTDLLEPIRRLNVTQVGSRPLDPVRRLNVTQVDSRLYWTLSGA